MLINKNKTYNNYLVINIYNTIFIYCYINYIKNDLQFYDLNKLN